MSGVSSRLILGMVLSLLLRDGWPGVDRPRAG